MKHIDLFSGIGGFAYAIDQIFHDEKNEHVFCDNDKFCQAILKKHWPEAKIYGDIRTFTNTESTGQNGGVEHGASESGEAGDPASNATSRKPGKQTKQKRRQDTSRSYCDILTGGFPCQPFSQAGHRKGTADDRYLWPEMLRVIRENKPTWVIAENVRGLTTWNDGMVLEQVCADLEGEGYEVQAFIIPAVSVNAPHRRDRVWITAYSQSRNDRGKLRDIPSSGEAESESKEQYKNRPGKFTDADSDAPDPEGERNGRSTGKKCRASERKLEQEKQEGREVRGEGQRRAGIDWNKDWREIASATCHDGMDDGLPRELDGAPISRSKHRNERIKACGNAIVPQVAMQILLAIKKANELQN